MLSNLTKFYLYISGNLAWLGGGVPTRFTNHPNQNSFVVLPKSKYAKRNQYEKASIILNILYVVFVAWRVISLKTGNASLAVLVETSYVLTCYTVSVIIGFQAVLKGDVTPYFISAYMQFFQDIYVNFKPVASSSKISTRHNSRSVIKCNAFLTTLFIVGNLIFLQNFLLMCKNPDAPHFLTSLINPGYKNVKVFRVPLMILQCWVWYNLWTNIYFYIFPIYVYACAAIRLLQELK